MRWYSIVSLLSNSRVRFLFGFIVVAIVVAVVLIFVEVLLRRRKVYRTERMVEDAPINEMRKFLGSDGTPKEKLDFVNKIAKEYFRRVYGAPIGSGYSMLAERFKKDMKEREVVFCEAMFVSYYSDKELTDSRARALGNLLVDVVNKKKRLEEISELPSFSEKIIRFFNRYLEVVKKKRWERIERRRIRRRNEVTAIEKKKLLKIVGEREKVVAKREKILVLRRIREERIKNKKMCSEKRCGKKTVVASRKEIRGWVGNVVDRNYSREKVLNLLNNGDRSLKETSRVLNVFDKKVDSLEKKNLKKAGEKINLSSEGEGVASRIVREGKECLS